MTETQVTWHAMAFVVEMNYHIYFYNLHILYTLNVVSEIRDACLFMQSGKIRDSNTETGTMSMESSNINTIVC